MIYLSEYTPRSRVIREGHYEDCIHLDSLSTRAWEKNNDLSSFANKPILPGFQKIYLISPVQIEK